MTAANKLEVTLIRSLIGKNKKHRSIVNALGLRKINDKAQFSDNKSIRGSIHKVSFMLKVEELNNE